MNNALKDWLNDVSHELDNLGIRVSIANGYQPGSYSVNLDGYNFVGTLCFWPNDKFEFQFNNCNTGNVILLETLYFDSPLQLKAYLDEWVLTKLFAHKTQ